MIRRLYPTAILLFLSLISCRSADDTVAIQDAYNQIYFSVQFKQKQCSSPVEPSPSLILVNPPLKHHLDLCTLAITRSPGCPLTGYPRACLLLYINEDIEIPWYTNYDEELVKKNI
jgi:hypothetical protein